MTLRLAVFLISVKRPVPGIAIGLSFLNLTVRKTFSNFLFPQELLDNGISSSLICLILCTLPNLRITLMRACQICIVHFLFCIVIIVAFSTWSVPNSATKGIWSMQAVLNLPYSAATSRDSPPRFKTEPNAVSFSLNGLRPKVIS